MSISSPVNYYNKPGESNREAIKLLRKLFTNEVEDTMLPVEINFQDTETAASVLASWNELRGERFAKAGLYQTGPILILYPLAQIGLDSSPGLYDNGPVMGILTKEQPHGLRD